MLICSEKNNSKNLYNLSCMENYQKQNSILNLIKLSLSIVYI